MMGKKGQKKKNSNLSISYSDQSSQNSSFGSFNVSNTSLNEASKIPEKLLVTSVESAGCDKYAKCLKSDWEDIVFIHPVAMRGCNIEDLVLIRGEEKTVLCTAYPLENLRKTSIVFPKGNCSFKNQELVSVSVYESRVKSAEEILIACDGELENTCQNMNQYILRLLSNKYIYTGLVVKCNIFGRDYECTVKSISCSPDISNLSSNPGSNPDVPEFYKVTFKTILKAQLKSVDKSYSFECIGGLEEQIKVVQRYMETFLNSDNSMNSVYCGTLMFDGPSGTGKSSLLQAFVNSWNIFTETITWYQLCAVSQSEARKELGNAFQRAKDKAPSIIVIDDFHYVCPTNGGNLHQNISKTLLQLLETLDETKVFVLAATNNSDCDTSVLQTSRRIMETIKFQIPSAAERTDILKTLLDSRHHELNLEEIQRCARLAHGFTGKDLSEAIKDAQIFATKKQFSEILVSSEFLNIIRSKSGDIGILKYPDIECSLKLKKPSIVTSNLKIKKVHWSDIGGMSDVKEKLKQLVEWPLKFPEAFKHFNITPSRGVLMYGPPGCSKTMIAKALATECELNFISKNASDLFDKYVGESERAVRDLFAMAKAKSPCIIFLDEIDALVVERGSSSSSSGVGDRIVTTLLTEMDGIEELQGVIIIAATNRPDMLDDALIRNGRINHFIYVPLPDKETREEVLKISMRNRLLSEDLDFKELIEKTDGYSGAEIVNLCNEAALQVLYEDPKAQTPVFRFHHFKLALKYVLPRTNKEMIKFYENFNEKHCKKC